MVASATTGPERRTTLAGLRPDTAYTARVRAVNAVGAGTWNTTTNKDTAVVVSTRPLPPAPPKCECVNFNHNSLKLKWGEGGHGGGRNAHAMAAVTELYHYTLEMENSRSQ